MSTRHVEIHPEAIAEAQAANQWYRERSASAADAYLSELDSAVEAIAENPELWPRYVHGTRRYIFQRFPFHLVYPKNCSKNRNHCRGSRSTKTWILEKQVGLVSGSRKMLDKNRAPFGLGVTLCVTFMPSICLKIKFAIFLYCI